MNELAGDGELGENATLYGDLTIPVQVLQSVFNI